MEILVFTSRRVARQRQAVRRAMGESPERGARGECLERERPHLGHAVISPGSDGGIRRRRAPDRQRAGRSRVDILNREAEPLSARVIERGEGEQLEATVLDVCCVSVNEQVGPAVPRQPEAHRAGAALAVGAKAERYAAQSIGAGDKFLARRSGPPQAG